MAGNNRAISIQSPNDLSKYRVNRPGQLEVFRQSLYDYQVAALAGQNQLTYFQVPIGGTQGAVIKTPADTNMQLAGQLPSGQQFLVQSIECKFWPGVNPSVGPVADAPDSFVNDVFLWNKTGWLEFLVGSKVYLREAPIERFPPKTRLDGWASITSTLTAGAATESRISYATSSGRPYPIDPYILLESTQNFAVSLNWIILQPLTTAGRAGIILDGLLIRNSQ